MSLGSALFEEMVFDNGQPINSTFLEYMPPSMEDHPRRVSIDCWWRRRIRKDRLGPREWERRRWGRWSRRSAMR